MTKTLKIYIVILILLIVGASFMESKITKPINWNPTYGINDKIPFGLFIFNQEINTFFKTNKVEKTNNTPYQFLVSNFDYKDSLDYNYKIKGTFLYINNFASLDDNSINEILTYTSYGNKTFISAKDFPRKLLDTLKVNLTTEFSSNEKIFNGIYGKENSIYELSEGATYSYFDKFEKNTTTKLGFIKIDTPKPNFIKVEYHSGEIYLHNQPVAFTNFHLLKKKNYEYAEKILQTLPNENIYWYTKEQSGRDMSNSPLRFILSQPSLKWAWWLFLLGLFAFIIFNAKRKQRVVPIVKPLPNTTIEFVKTIGNLYLQEKDYNNVITKKIIYFLEKIRNEYLVDTTHLDENFIKRFHQKSGKNQEDIRKAINLIIDFKKSNSISTEKDLITITNAIEKIIL
jgi:hypothetical protein